MTKLEIIQSAIELSGRFDLTEEMADGIVKADFFLNAALKYLDTTQQTPESQKNLIKDIHKGEYKLFFEYARSIKEVWIDTGDGEKRLEKVTLKEMNEQYPEKMFQDGTPYLNGDFITINSMGTITDSSLGLIDAGFQVGQYVKITGSQDKQNDGLFYITAMNPTGGEITVWKGDKLIQEDNHSHPDLALTPVTFIAETGTPTYYAVDSIHLSPQQKLLTFDQNEFNTDYYKIMFNSVGYNAIWWAAPADSDGVVRMAANFFSVMKEDSDTCYWSIVYPNALIQAMLFAIEVFYRNTAGMKDMLASLEPFLIGIDRDLAEESVVDINQMEG
jgi:hypothetical protein